MNINIISSKDFLVNQWSGGKTIQLFIYPNSSSLANRDFDFRISSATFTCTSSKFSDFSSYQRYLLSLRGQLFVEHQNLYSKSLDNYEIEYFLGSWNTSSNNSLDCVDFNFIVKEGIESNLLVLDELDRYIPKRKGKLFLYSMLDFCLEIHSDSLEILAVAGNTLVCIEEEDILNKIVIKSSKDKVVVCEVFV